MELGSEQKDLQLVQNVGFSVPLFLNSFYIIYSFSDLERTGERKYGIFHESVHSLFKGVKSLLLID